MTGLVAPHETVLAPRDERSRDGDDPATTAKRVRAAVDEHHALVYRVLRRLGVPARDAEDAQQQVFWVYARNLRRVEPGKDRAFLFGVAMRVAQSIRQHMARWTPASEEEVGLLVAPGDGADDRLDDVRARARLDALLEAMPMELRVVLVLHDLEEWTMRDIAATLTIPPGTVASRLRRARERLEELAREGT